LLLAERAKLQRLLAGIAFDSSVKHDESAAGESVTLLSAMPAYQLAR